MTSCLASIHYTWGPALHPYRSEQTVVLFALLVGLLVWCHVKPKPTWLVAGYMCAGSFVTMFATCMHTAARTSVSCEPAGWMILQASSALAACMYIEIFRTLRQRRQPVLALARALDRQTRRNSSE